MPGPRLLRRGHAPHPDLRRRSDAAVRSQVMRHARGARPRLPARPATTVPAAKPRERDPRLPAAGTTINRESQGKEIRVQVLEDGFRCDGKEYRPLSALATEVCGNSANGFLWLRLTPRPAPRPKQPKPAKVAKGKGEPAAPKDAAPETAPATESTTA